MALVAPSSLLLFLVSSSVWVALSSSPLPVTAASDGQGGEQCPPISCGDVTISFPFGLIPADAPQTNCGAGTGFHVRCSDNTPSLASFQSEHGMQILSIFYHNQSLLVTDTHWQGYFNSSNQRCSSFPTNTSTRLAAGPFSISSVNQNLIFYNCNKPPPALPGVDLVKTVCHQGHNTTFVRAAADDEPPGESGGYALEGCTAAMVTVLGVPGKVNASNYEQLVRDGFLATWQWPPPSSSGNFTLGVSNTVSCPLSRL